MILGTLQHRCPHCKGNLSLQEDHDGRRVQCLMCGRSAELRRYSGGPPQPTPEYHIPLRHYSGPRPLAL